MEPQNTPAQTNGNGSASDKSTAKQGKKIGIGIAVVAILAILGVTLASKKPATEESTPVDTGTSSTVQTNSAPSTATSSASATAVKAGTAEYKDGTYTATGSYISPGGPDKVGVSVTLKNDIITDATVTPMPGDPTSAHYQGIFAANYKQYVVGQDITKLNVHKVSGSSLTSGGFNDAITQIEAQAKA